ncbi:unnamed protein product, partial [Owenia fusiformis]
MYGRIGIWILTVIALTQGQNTGPDAGKGMEDGLPQFVVSECYGDIFNFDCGAGNRIRLIRDFFGKSSSGDCSYAKGDCTVTNPKANSLIQRYCAGERVCSFVQVEQRSCAGSFSSFQEVEYQCIPNAFSRDICTDTIYVGTSGYVSSPNFRGNYPPNLDCTCALTAPPGVLIRVEILYLAIHYRSPCSDYLQIGDNKLCGFSHETFTDSAFLLNFHTDEIDSHQGFWINFRSADGESEVTLQCGDPEKITTTTSTTTTTVPTTTTTPRTTTPPSTTTQSTTSTVGRRTTTMPVIPNGSNPVSTLLPTLFPPGGDLASSTSSTVSGGGNPNGGGETTRGGNQNGDTMGGGSTGEGNMGGGTGNGNTGEGNTGGDNTGDGNTGGGNMGDG